MDEIELIQPPNTEVHLTCVWPVAATRLLFAQFVAILALLVVVVLR